MTYITRTIKVVVGPSNEPIFGEAATMIEIVDDAAGEFVAIKQNHDDPDRGVLIDPSEWPAIRDAIEQMVRLCR